MHKVCLFVLIILPSWLTVSIGCAQGLLGIENYGMDFMADNKALHLLPSIPGFGFGEIIANSIQGAEKIEQDRKKLELGLDITGRVVTSDNPYDKMSTSELICMLCEARGDLSRDKQQAVIAIEAELAKRCSNFNKIIVATRLEDDDTTEFATLALANENLVPQLLANEKVGSYQGPRFTVVPGSAAGDTKKGGEGGEKKHEENSDGPTDSSTSDTEKGGKSNSRQDNGVGKHEVSDDMWVRVLLGAVSQQHTNVKVLLQDCAKRINALSDIVSGKIKIRDEKAEGFIYIDCEILDKIDDIEVRNKILAKALMKVLVPSEGGVFLLETLLVYIINKLKCIKVDLFSQIFAPALFQIIAHSALEHKVKMCIIEDFLNIITREVLEKISNIGKLFLVVLKTSILESNQVVSDFLVDDFNFAYKKVAQIEEVCCGLRSMIQEVQETHPTINIQELLYNTLAKMLVKNRKEWGQKILDNIGNDDVKREVLLRASEIKRNIRSGEEREGERQSMLEECYNTHQGYRLCRCLRDCFYWILPR